MKFGWEIVRGDNHGSEIQPQNKEAQIKELQGNKLGSKTIPVVKS